jgi:hypothetical protein
MIHSALRTPIRRMTLRYAIKRGWLLPMSTGSQHRPRRLKTCDYNF